MIVIAFLKSCIPIFDTSILSIKIFPPACSIIRNNASVIEDLPLINMFLFFQLMFFYFLIFVLICLIKKKF